MQSRLLRPFHCSCLSHFGVDDNAADSRTVARWTDGRPRRKLCVCAGERTGEQCIRLPGDGSRRFADDITGGLCRRCFGGECQQRCGGSSSRRRRRTARMRGWAAAVTTSRLWWVLMTTTVSGHAHWRSRLAAQWNYIAATLRRRILHHSSIYPLHATASSSRLVVWRTSQACSAECSEMFDEKVKD